MIILYYYLYSNRSNYTNIFVFKWSSSDQTVRNNTKQDLKEFNQQSLTTQAKKGEQLVSMMPAIKKAFNLFGDDIVELSVENDALKNQIGDYDQE